MSTDSDVVGQVGDNASSGPDITEMLLWAYRYEQWRLSGRTHPEDRLIHAVMRRLEANVLDPSHRGVEAVAAADGMRQAAIDYVGAWGATA